MTLVVCVTSNRWCYSQSQVDHLQRQWDWKLRPVKMSAVRLDFYGQNMCPHWSSSPPERCVQRWYNECAARQKMCQRVGKWFHPWQWSYVLAEHIEDNRHKCSTNGGNYFGKLMIQNFTLICCSGNVTRLYSRLTMKAASVVQWLACRPLVPEFAGSNPAEAVGFFGCPNNPQHAFLRRGSERLCPMSQLCGM